MDRPSSPPCGKIAALHAADDWQPQSIGGILHFLSKSPSFTIPRGNSPSEINCLLNSHNCFSESISLCSSLWNNIVVMVSFRWVFVFAPGLSSQSSWWGRPRRRWTGRRSCCPQSARSRPAGPQTSTLACAGAGPLPLRCAPGTPCFWQLRGSVPFPPVLWCLFISCWRAASLFARLCWSKTSNPSDSAGCQGTPGAQSCLGTDQTDQGVLAEGQTVRMELNINRTNASRQQLVRLLNQQVSSSKLQTPWSTHS